MNYYRWHIGDYRRDTAHLSMLEHGAYRQLLDSYYLNEKPLPLDDATLMRTHCARSAEEMQAVRNVLADFFVKTDEGYVHKHCERELEAYKAKSDKARESANARWQKEIQIDDANALRPDCDGNANHKPITNNQDNKPASPKRGKSPAIQISTFIAACQAKSEAAIPDGDPVFKYSEEVGIPADFLWLCWREFVDRYTETGKRQADWRQTFRNCVRGNWYKLWWVGSDGVYQLTTTGVQAQRKHSERAA